MTSHFLVFPEVPSFVLVLPEMSIGLEPANFFCDQQIKFGMNTIFFEFRTWILICMTDFKSMETLDLKCFSFFAFAASKKGERKHALNTQFFVQCQSFELCPKVSFA